MECTFQDDNKDSENFKLELLLRSQMILITLETLQEDIHRSVRCIVTNNSTKTLYHFQFVL